MFNGPYGGMHMLALPRDGKARVTVLRLVALLAGWKAAAALSALSLANGTHGILKVVVVVILLLAGVTGIVGAVAIMRGHWLGRKLLLGVFASQMLSFSFGNVGLLIGLGPEVAIRYVFGDGFGAFLGVGRDFYFFAGNWVTPFLQFDCLSAAAFLVLIGSAFPVYDGAETKTLPAG